MNIYIIIFTLIACVTCSCNSNAEDNTSQENKNEDKAKKEILITEKDNNKKIEVSQKLAVKVKLEVSMGTGYKWMLQHNKFNKIKLVKEYLQEENEKKNDKIVGQKEYQIFLFSIFTPTDKEEKKSDEDKITFEYKRPWEKEQKPEKTFSVTLLITK